jgi:hypothetical protein
MAVRTVSELAAMVERDPKLAEEIKADPAGALANHAYTTDPKFYRIAIIGLISIIVLVIIAALVIAMEDTPQGQTAKSLPDWISALATTALGGLVGLFAPSPTDK